jgi:hypothetical protein
LWKGWKQPVQHLDGWNYTYFCLKSRVERATWVQTQFQLLGTLAILHSQPFTAAYIYGDKAGF